jgi:hypothetical protein
MSVWVQLPGWAKHTILAALVGLVFAEVRNVIVWLVKKRHASIDRKVKELLAALTAGDKTTAVEISKTSGFSQRRVRASLNRLDDKLQATHNSAGQWWEIRRSVSN